MWVVIAPPRSTIFTLATFLRKMKKGPSRRRVLPAGGETGLAGASLKGEGCESAFLEESCLDDFAGGLEHDFLLVRHEASRIVEFLGSRACTHE